MAEAWIVRHAETEWSAARRHTGPHRPAADRRGARGRPGAGAAARRRRAVRRRLTSPLSRARETAALAGFGDVAVPREALAEWDYGDYEGRTTAEIHEQRPGWFLWRDGCPGGETAFDVARRIDPIADELAALTDAAGEDERVLVFAHSHLLRVLTARWLGLPPGDGALFVLGTAAVGVLGWERSVRALQGWNVA